MIDVLEQRTVWFSWSAAALADAAVQGAQVSSIVVAELCRGFPSIDALRAELATLEVRTVPLDDASAFLAGERFQDFRRTRDKSKDARVLPDFLIGAHAVTLGVPLLTRDSRLYRRYFPELSLITPETTHG